jgi:hypothetical protein
MTDQEESLARKAFGITLKSVINLFTRDQASLILRAVPLAGLVSDWVPDLMGRQLI